MDILIIGTLMAVIIYQGIMNYLEKKEHKKEKSELINRIMSKNFTEYASNQKYLDEDATAPTSQDNIDREVDYYNRALEVD